MLDVNSPAVPIALFGSAWSGVPFAPLNYRLTADEVERLVEQIAPALLITDAERAPALEKLDGIRVLARDDFLDRVLAETESAGAGEWPMEPDDIAILLFTSGTTGAPKAAVIEDKREYELNKHRLHDPGEAKKRGDLQRARDEQRIVTNSPVLREAMLSKATVDNEWRSMRWFKRKAYVKEQTGTSPNNKAHAEELMKGR